MDDLLKWFTTIKFSPSLILAMLVFLLIWKFPVITTRQWWRAAINLLKLRWQVWRNPNDANAHFLLGDQLYPFERYAKAEEAYRNAIRLDPQHKQAFNNLGKIVKNDESRLSEAETLLCRAIEIDSNYVQAIVNLGNIQLSAKHYPEAKSTFENAIKVDPKFAPAYLGIGRMQIMLNHYAEATEPIQRSIELDSSNANAHSMLGILQSMANHFAEAEKSFQQALKINPADEITCRQLVLVLRFQNRDREALPLLERIETLCPRDLNTWIALAIVHKKLGNKQKVAKYIIQVKKKISPDDWYNLACLESICDDREKALDYLQRLQEQNELDCKWALQDPDLGLLHQDPRFEQIVGAPP